MKTVKTGQCARRRWGECLTPQCTVRGDLCLEVACKGPSRREQPCESLGEDMQVEGRACVQTLTRCELGFLRRKQVSAAGVH